MEVLPSPTPHHDTFLVYGLTVAQEHEPSHRPCLLLRLLGGGRSDSSRLPAEPDASGSLARCERL